MTAWVPSWDKNAVPLMQTHAGKLHESNPGWYTIAADGTFTKNYGAEDLAMRAALTGTQLIPTIKNHINGRFDGTIVATVLASPTLRETHAESLTRLVVEQAFDGIDIDYERVPTTSRADFTAFIQLLGAKLHGARKTLSVTVVAKESDSENWNGPGSQDWIALGRVADTIKIMAYDKHWNGSEAGPLTPLSWLDGVGRYASQTLPRGKAIIGLPWYGYDWLGKAATTVTYAQAMDKARSIGATVTRDTSSGELTYTYDGRTVFFQDAQSYRTKAELITSKYPAIGGFAHWRVGAEDTATWDVVGQLKAVGSGSAPIQAPAGDFAIDSPSAIAVTAGAQQSAGIAIVGINGFSGTATISAEMIDAFAGTLSFATPTINPRAGTTLTVTASRYVTPGLYRVKVIIASGAIRREQTLVVSISAAPRMRAVRR